MSAITTSDHFRRSLATDETGRDEIDRQFVEPSVAAENPPCRRGEGETSRLLRILDEIERGQG